MFKNFVRSHRLLINQIRQLNTMQSKQVVIKGQTINYIKEGTGKHNLLCFPGALGTIWTDFKPQIEGLDKTKFTIVAWDPPGYGNSRPMDRQFNTDFYHQDAVTANDFMQQGLGVKQYSVLGWSDGGISALIMAAKYKEAITNLVIWGSNAYVTKEELDGIEKIRDVSKWSDRMKKPLVALYTEDGLQQMWNDWCDVLQTIYKENGGNICKELLEKIDCPTFILHGKKDPVVAEEHPGYLKEHIRNSKLFEFPDGKHNIHLRYPTEFNTLVSDFLEEGSKSKC